MKSFAIGPAAASRAAARQSRTPVDLRPLLGAAVAAVLAIAIQCLWIPIDADVSWLITVCERLLSGDRLYTDIVELNPPASVWLYLPLVWLAQLLGARPEAVVAAGFILAGLGSVGATARLASKLDDAPPTAWLAPVLALLALVLPMALFAQREHAALLLALPALTALAAIGEGKRLSRPALYASGIAAGLIIVIKPYFLLALVAPAAWVAWKRRSVLPIVPGAAAAALTVGLYAGALLLFARSYFDWLPVIAHTYGPMRKAAWAALVGPALYPAICLALALLLRPGRVPALASVWALGSAGFVLAAVAQGKNYPNHLLPGVALALAAALVVVALPRLDTIRRASIGAALAAVAGLVMYQWTIVPDPAVAAAIRRVGPPEPRIIALSPQLTTGHPVTRNVGGRWVGSRAGLFTASGALYVGLDDPVARRAYREDLQSFATDVRRHSPDLILVDSKAKAWLMAEQIIAETMQAYAPVESAAGVEIWLRRPPQRAD